MPVYLDHAATTPMLPEAIDAYARAMAVVGNPSSIHSAGQTARRMLEEAREQLAETLDCDPIEVVFTSGGTEAINLALKGLFWQRNAAGARPRVIVPAGEHHAVMDTVEWLERHEGATPAWVPLERDGLIDVDAWRRALAGGDAALATAIWANNEVGTLQPVGALAAAALEASVPLHLDAVAAYGQVPVSFRSLPGLAALSVSAHKIGGPVGIGALVLSRSASVEPIVHGGGQQRGVRSGTQDVAAAVSFAVAAEASARGLDAHAARLAGLRDRLIAGIHSAVPAAVLSGPEGTGRLPGNVHFTFPGAQGDSLLFLLDAAGVAVSTGSACQAGIPEPSHVVLAMGRSEDEARGALRITLGHTSTDADVDALLAALPGAYERAARAGLSDRLTTLGR